MAIDLATIHDGHSQLDEVVAALKEATRCLRFVRCDICGERYDRNRDCMLADHIEATEAIMRADGLLKMLEDPT